MNTKFKYTKTGQMLDVLKTHAVNAMIFIFIWLTLIVVWSNTVGEYVYTFIAAVSYFFAVYSCGETAAKNDKKSYVEGDPDLKKCLYIPLLLIIVNIIVVVTYKLTWVFGSDGNSIQELWSLVTNIISVAWFAGFGVLSGMDKGSFSLLGIICIVVLPYLAYFLGYLAGVKKFDISEVMFGFMYEKKKK